MLVTPCIAYVIVFTRQAWGAAGKLLALTPVLLVLQLLLLPVYLRLTVGEIVGSAAVIAPAAQAFGLFIVLPLGVAALTRVSARRWGPAQVWASRAGAVMVPAMAAVLLAVTVSAAPALLGLGAMIVRLGGVIVAFAVIMGGLAWLSGRVLHFEAPEARAMVFTGVTRNSLVMLPLVAAISPGDWETRQW